MSARLLEGAILKESRGLRAWLWRLCPGAMGTIEQSYLGAEIELFAVDELTAAWCGRERRAEDRTGFALLTSSGTRASGLVFDIGAHQELVAILLRKKLVPLGSVTAVEIDKLNVAACGRNFRLNGQEVVAVRAAVLDGGATVFAERKSNEGVASDGAPSGSPRQRAAATTIDCLISLYGVPELVYIDIGGAGVLAMRGAAKTLDAVPNWCVELHGDEVCGDYGGSNLDVAKRFEAAGFVLYISGPEEEPLARLDRIVSIPSERCHLIACRHEVAARAR